jgi:hypothetical protein
VVARPEDAYKGCILQTREFLRQGLHARAPFLPVDIESMKQKDDVLGPAKPVFGAFGEPAGHNGAADICAAKIEFVVHEDLESA